MKQGGSLNRLLTTTTLEEIKAANQTLSTHHEASTAIFTGATQGVGLVALQAFATHVPMPKAIIVGRSRQHFEDKLQRLKLINPKGEFIFIEGQVSLIKSIDAICEQIKDLVPSRTVEFLCMSQGYAPIEGRRFTSEGLNEVLALAYYGRVRMAENLVGMGLMKPSARVLTVLAGGKESTIFEDDLPLERNYSIFNLRGQSASMTTFSMDRLAVSEHGLRARISGKSQNCMIDFMIHWS